MNLADFRNALFHACQNHATHLQRTHEAIYEKCLLLVEERSRLSQLIDSFFLRIRCSPFKMKETNQDKPNFIQMLKTANHIYIS